MATDRSGSAAAWRIGLIAAAFFAAALAGGCARSADRPRIDFGSPCASCGMEIRDAHFACLRRGDGTIRQYDAIECLLRDGTPNASEVIYLADYDGSALHSVDSIWVVKGDFASPMSGGFAAFLSRASADQIASETHGRVGRLREFTRSAGS